MKANDTFDVGDFVEILGGPEKGRRSPIESIRVSGGRPMVNLEDSPSYVEPKNLRHVRRGPKREPMTWAGSGEGVPVQETR